MERNQDAGAARPQLLEAAWVRLAGGGSYQAIISGAESDALTALAGQKFTFISLSGKPNQEIGALILQQYNAGQASGEPVGIGTLQDASGTKGDFSLGPGSGNVYYEHAYVVENVLTDADGNVTAVVLLNPWGKVSHPHDYQITVPIADFSAMFGALFYLQ